MILFKKFLNIYYKAYSLINIYAYRNKYLIISLIIMAIITFIFNKNINSAVAFFKDLDLKNITLNNWGQVSILALLLPYLSHTKFNIMVKLVLLVKGIIFFYQQWKLIQRQNVSPIAIKRAKDSLISVIITFIAINLVIMLILYLFMTNLTNNLYKVNSEIGEYMNLYSSLISIILLFSILEKIIYTKFQINNQPVNSSLVLLNICLTFLPFIYFNFFGSFNFEKYFDQFIIHCESKDDLDFNNKIKEPDSIISKEDATDILPNNEEIKDIILSKEDAEKLLSGLEELKFDSDQMTVSDYFKENFSSFEEAFPNLVKDKTLKEIFTESSHKLNEAKYAEANEVLKPILTEPKTFFSFLHPDRDLRYLQIQKLVNGNFSGLYDKAISNTNYSDLILKMNANTNIQEFRKDPNLPFLNYLGKGHLQLNIDLNKSEEMFREMVEIYNKNKDYIKLDSLFPTISAFIIYNKVVKLFNKTAFPETKVKAKLNLSNMKARAHTTFLFQTTGGIVITGCLFLMSNLYKDFLLNKNLSNINNNTDLSAFNKSFEDKNKILSLIPIFNNNKNSKWLRLILIICSFIFMYYLQPYLPTIFYYLGFIKGTWLILFSSLILSLGILYYLFIIYFILKIKYSQMNKKDLLLPYEKYLPNFIKNDLIDSFEISKSKFLYIHILIRIKSIIGFFILLLFNLFLYFYWVLILHI